jgi:hypothetical protein
MPRPMATRTLSVKRPAISVDPLGNVTRLQSNPEMIVETGEFESRTIEATATHSSRPLASPGTWRCDFSISNWQKSHTEEQISTACGS